MVSEENRRNKFTPRKKYTPERRERQKAILERARQTKGSKPIPLTYKERLTILENNNNNSNNNSDTEDLIPTMDYLSTRLDELEEENTTLINRIEELESNVDANDTIIDELDDKIQEIKDSIDTKPNTIIQLENDLQEMKKLVDILWDDLQTQLGESDED